MPIITMKRYTREEIQSRPDVLFVFGDNLVRKGLGGQAAAARGEPNAIGIPTKRRPSMDEDAFFSNDDLEQVRPIIQAEFRKLAEHLKHGGTVVLPADGVGSGRAMLSTKAPSIKLFIDRCFAHLNTLG